MNTHEAKPSHRAKSGRRRGLMGMALALLMLLPTLAISSASAAPTSAAARAVGSFKVRTTYFWPGSKNARQMSAGQAIDWRGYVSPYSSSSRVVIQYKVGSRWYDGAKAQPYGSGYYRVKQKFTSPGMKTIRLRVYSGNKSYNTWTGYPVNVTVYAWHNLTSLNAVTSDFEEGPLPLNGTYFADSIIDENATGDYGEWNLSRKCTTFQASVGVGDLSSYSGGVAEMRVGGDSVPLKTLQAMLGTRTPISVNMSGYLRLVLETRDLTGGYYDPAFGNARIRCAW